MERGRESQGEKRGTFNPPFSSLFSYRKSLSPFFLFPLLMTCQRKVFSSSLPYTGGGGGGGARVAGQLFPLRWTSSSSGRRRFEEEQGASRCHE